MFNLKNLANVSEVNQHVLGVSINFGEADNRRGPNAHSSPVIEQLLKVVGNPAKPYIGKIQIKIDPEVRLLTHVGRDIFHQIHLIAWNNGFNQPALNPIISIPDQLGSIKVHLEQHGLGHCFGIGFESDPGHFAIEWDYLKNLYREFPDHIYVNGHVIKHVKDLIKQDRLQKIRILNPSPLYPQAA